MPKFLVDIQSTASAVVKVDISNEILQNLANDLDTTIENLATADILDLVYELMETPTICAQCSGWGNEKISLSLGDEWNICDDEGETDPKYKSIRLEEK